MADLEEPKFVPKLSAFLSNIRAAKAGTTTLYSNTVKHRNSVSTSTFSRSPLNTDSLTDAEVILNSSDTVRDFGESNSIPEPIGSMLNTETTTEDIATLDGDETAKVRHIFSEVKKPSLFLC